MLEGHITLGFLAAHTETVEIQILRRLAKGTLRGP
jgi:hypothetical protein